MSDTGTALLRTILTRPHDDAPRLIFADWLDENDQPRRAHFIRQQIAHPPGAGATGLEDTLKKRLPIKGRWPALCDQPAWDITHTRVTVPTTVIVGNSGKSVVGFERGFPAWVYLPWGDWVTTTVRRAFARHPIIKVYVDQATVTPWAWPGEAGGYGFQGLPARWIAHEAGLGRGGPYPSPAAAKKAMSDALVAIGRMRAGLDQKQKDSA